MAGKAAFTMGASGAYSAMSNEAFQNTSNQELLRSWRGIDDEDASSDEDDVFDPSDLRHNRSLNEISFWDHLKETINRNVKSEKDNGDKMQKMMKNTFIAKMLARRKTAAAAKAGESPTNVGSSNSAPQPTTTPSPSSATAMYPYAAPTTPPRTSLLAKLKAAGTLTPKGAKVYHAGPSTTDDEYAAAEKQNANNETNYYAAARDTNVANPFLEKVRKKAEMAKKRQKEKHRKVINPYARWKLCWDFGVGALIAYSVIVIPWRISFQQDTTPSTFPYYFEISLDVIFGLDMFFTCITGIYMPNGRFVADRKVLANRYLQSWFFVDLVSTFPFDRLLPLISDTAQNNNNLAVRALKLLRSTRLVRLLRVAKILRLDEKFERISDLNEMVSPALVRLIKLLYKILFVAHLLACFWFFTNSCVPVGSSSIPLDADDVWTICGSNSLVSQYIASFYWTIATMMAVGYGDIYAVTNEERFYAITTQVVGAVAFGFIIATVTIIIETLDPGASAKRRRKDELVDYLNERGYSRDLQKRARKHFAYFQNKTSAFAEMHIVGELSHTLREVLLFESRNYTIPNIKLFRFEVSDQFITECVLRLKPMIMAYHQSFGNKGDISEEVYFVTKGRIEGLNMVPLDKDEYKTPTNKSDKENSVSEAEEDTPSHKVVIALIISDGYELELSNCLNEKPMDLRYRAASVTDVLWLDHGSLMYLKSCFFRSIIALHSRANRYDKLIKIVFNTPVKEYGEGLFMHNKIIKNSTLVKSADVKETVMMSIRTPMSPAQTQQKLSKRDGGSNIKHEFSKVKKVSSKNNVNEKDDLKKRRLSIAIGRSPSGLLRGSSSTNIIDEEESTEVFLRTWVFDPIKNRLLEKEETEEDLRKRYLLNPNSPAKLKWDLFIGLLIICSVIIVPLRLGFDIDLTTEWMGFDWSTDFFFALDIFINFRTGYMDEQQILHTSPNIVAKHYARGWFFIDLVSTIPFDKIVSLFLDASDSDQLRSLRLIRIVRLVRLAKLIKLLKQQSNNDASSDIFNMSPIFVKIGKLLATLFFIGHIFGCFFSYITLDAVHVYGSDLNVTNIENFAGGYYPHEIPFNSEIPWNGVSAWWVKLGHPEEDVWSRYLASLYWAFTTMTTVGYGDILPTTDVERIYASFIMILGATVFGYIVGSVSGLASNPHGALARANERKLLIQNYLEEQNIKPALRRMAKEQCDFNKNFISVFDEARILSNFPINIRREMIVETHAETIAKISIFSDDISLITNVMHYLKPAFFAAGQYIYRTADEGVKAIMFLLDGIAEEVPDKDWKTLQKQNSAPNATIMKLYSTNHLSAGSGAKEGEEGKGLHRKIIEAGKCFGYQCFVAESENSGKKPPPTAYRAFTACSIMLLTEYAMKSIIERHPVLREKLREALKEAIIRQTASDEVLNNQVKAFKKKNSMFSALQGAMTGGKNVDLLRRAIDSGGTVQDVKDSDKKETLAAKIKREKENAAVQRKKSKEKPKAQETVEHAVEGDDDLEVEHA